MKTVFLTLVACALAIALMLAGYKLTHLGPNPVAVGLSDGRVLFGNLHGNTLCNYVQPVTGRDPKTHKPVISLQQGGALYGGDGCLEIKEPILFVEHLTPASTVYKQLTTSK